jgi:hypothetical protein
MLQHFSGCLCRKEMLILKGLPARLPEENQQFQKDTTETRSIPDTFSKDRRVANTAPGVNGDQGAAVLSI